MTIAITRAVPPSLGRGELTHLERTPIDVAAAARQHAAYEQALRELGCAIVRLPRLPQLPDSVFVEDGAVVLDEAAVVTRPGAASRRGETASVRPLLERYRPVRCLTAPATLDGGDVLAVGRRLYVGRSSRTNEEGARQLAQAAAPFGYTVETVTVSGCLHLKSAATAVEPGVIICNPRWIDPRVFVGVNIITVHPDEPLAANVLAIGVAVLAAAAHVRTAADLSRRGYTVHPVDVSELAKAEAGVTCCSLIVRQTQANPGQPCG